MGLALNSKKNSLVPKQDTSFFFLEGYDPVYFSLAQGGLEFISCITSYVDGKPITLLLIKPPLVSSICLSNSSVYQDSIYYQTFLLGLSKYTALTQMCFVITISSFVIWFPNAAYSWKLRMATFKTACTLHLHIIISLTRILNGVL